MYVVLVAYNTTLHIMYCQYWFYYGDFFSRYWVYELPIDLNFFLCFKRIFLSQYFLSIEKHQFVSAKIKLLWMIGCVIFNKSFRRSLTRYSNFWQINKLWLIRWQIILCFGKNKVSIVFLAGKFKYLKKKVAWLLTYLSVL